MEIGSWVKTKFGISKWKHTYLTLKNCESTIMKWLDTSSNLTIHFKLTFFQFWHHILQIVGGEKNLISEWVVEYIEDEKNVCNLFQWILSDLKFFYCTLVDYDFLAFS